MNLTPIDISAVIMSGLAYDAFKYGTINYLDYIKEVFKDSILSDEEKTIIALELKDSKEEDRSSKENLENFFKTKAPNTQGIINKYQTQNNITNNGSGDVVLGDQIKHTGSGHIILQKEELKKY